MNEYVFIIFYSIRYGNRPDCQDKVNAEQVFYKTIEI